MRIVASTQAWNPLKASREGPYFVFRSNADRAKCARQLRDLVLKARPAGTSKRPTTAVAEEALFFMVQPREGPKR